MNRKIPVTIDGSKDPKYRLTESLSSFGHCSIRSRDTNIFLADQVRKTVSFEWQMYVNYLVFCLET